MIRSPYLICHDSYLALFALSMARSVIVSFVIPDYFSVNIENLTDWKNRNGDKGEYSFFTSLINAIMNEDRTPLSFPIGVNGKPIGACHIAIVK